MIKTRTEQAYLTDLKESINIFDQRRVTTELDFSNSTYSGDETLGEMLSVVGVDDIENLQEGILSMPIKGLKNIAFKLSKQAGSLEGMRASKKDLQPIANKVKPEMIKKQIKSMADSKGIPSDEIKKAEVSILRVFTGAMQTLSIFTNPIGWILLLVALIKSGDVKTFREEFSSMLKEMEKSTKNIDSEFEQSTALGSLAIKLLLFCLIPPWVQSVVLYPLAVVYGLFSYFTFIVAFLGQFGK